MMLGRYNHYHLILSWVVSFESTKIELLSKSLIMSDGFARRYFHLQENFEKVRLGRLGKCVSCLYMRSEPTRVDKVVGFVPGRLPSPLIDVGTKFMGSNTVEQDFHKF